MAPNKTESKIRRWLLAAVRYLVASVSAGIFFYILFALVFSTEEERQLQKENRLYSNMYSAMKAKEELIGDVIEGLLDKDGAIYEELFDTEPPSLDEVYGVRPSAEHESAVPGRYYLRSTTPGSDSLMAQAARVEQNFDEVFRMLQERSDTIPPLSLPLKDMSYVQVGASVGMKQNPVYHLQVQHNGLDLIAPQGTPVYAAAPGRVSKVNRTRKGLGNEVEIDHGNGYKTRYCLLGDISVTQGRMVKKGQQLGTVGISTVVSAAHLHFEVYYKGEVKDPVDYFFASLSPEEYSRVRFLAAKTSQSMD